MRAPLAASGWLIAIAPPWMLNFSRGILSSISTATYLSGERFVHLDEVHLIERHPGALERDLGRGHRADAHDRGIHAGDAPGHEAREGLEPLLLRPLVAGDHERAGAVADAARVAGGDHAVRLEHRLELRQPLGGGVGPHVLIAAELFHQFRLRILDRDADDLVLEHAGRPRFLGLHLGTQRVLVHRGAADRVLRRELLRGLGHRESGHGIAEAFPEGILEHRDSCRAARPSAGRARCAAPATCSRRRRRGRRRPGRGGSPWRR